MRATAGILGLIIATCSCGPKPPQDYAKVNGIDVSAYNLELCGQGAGFQCALVGDDLADAGAMGSALDYYDRGCLELEDGQACFWAVWRAQRYREAEGSFEPYVERFAAHAAAMAPICAGGGVWNEYGFRLDRTTRGCEAAASFFAEVGPRDHAREAALSACERWNIVSACRYLIEHEDRDYDLVAIEAGYAERAEADYAENLAEEDAYLAERERVSD